MRNELNVSGSKPLKDIWREPQVPGKQAAKGANPCPRPQLDPARARDSVLTQLGTNAAVQYPPGKEDSSLSEDSAVLGHVLTHGNGRDERDEEVDREGTENTGSFPDSEESGERIVEAPVFTIGNADSKSDAGAKLEAGLEFRARVDTGRTDISVLRTEARAILVRLLVRFYVDREKAVNKPAA